MIAASIPASISSTPPRTGSRLAGDAEAVAARIRERDEVHPAWRAGRVAHVVSAHRADAEDSYVEYHVRHPPPRAR